MHIDRYLNKLIDASIADFPYEVYVHFNDVHVMLLMRREYSSSIGHLPY